MAVRTYRVQNAKAAGVEHLDTQETDITLVTGTTGWVVAKVAAGNDADMDSLTERASSALTSQSTNPKPLTPDNTLGNCFRLSENGSPFNGTFAAAAWTIAAVLRSVTNVGGTVRVRCRVFAATNTAGTTGVRELTSATQVGSTITLSTTVDATSTITWTPASAITLVNEYVFVAIALEVVTAGGSTGSDAHLRHGSSTTGTRIVTSDYVLAAIVNQASFRGRNDDGTETTATWKAAQSTDFGVDFDKTFRLRFEIEETNGGSLTTALRLQYSKNGGAWTNVGSASSNIVAAASPNITDGVATTDQLTASAGTFLAGSIDEVDGSVASLTLTSHHTEVEFCVQAKSADLAVGDSIQLRVADSTGTALSGTYVTPTVTITSRRARITWARFEVPAPPALVVQAVPASATFSGVADVALGAGGLDVQAVPASATFSAVVTLAESLQAVPATATMSAPVPTLATALQAIPASATFSMLVTLSSVAQAPAASFAASTPTLSLSFKLSAPPASFTASVGSVSAGELVNSPAATFTASAMAYFQTIFVQAVPGSAMLSAVASLAEAAQALPGTATLSAAASVLRAVNSPGGTVTLSGASTASEALTAPPASVAFSSVVRAGPTPTAVASVTFSGPTAKLAETLTSPGATVTFSAQVNVGGIPLQVTSPGGTFTVSALATLAQALSAVPASVTFSSDAKAAWLLGTTPGTSTFNGGASLASALQASAADLQMPSTSLPTFSISVFSPAATATFSALAAAFYLSGLRPSWILSVSGGKATIISAAEAAESIGAGGEAVLRRATVNLPIER